MLRWNIGYFVIIPTLCVDIQVKNSSFDANYSTTPESVHFINLEQSVTCKFQPNGYDCDGSGWFRPIFYYDIKLEDCRTYTVGNCQYNLNAYNSLSECHTTCRDVGAHWIPKSLSTKIFCRLQPDFGFCNGYNPRWYYDVTTRRCRGFSYSGCGGNLNRFQTQQSCATTCSGSLGLS